MLPCQLAAASPPPILVPHYRTQRTFLWHGPRPVPPFPGLVPLSGEQQRALMRMQGEGGLQERESAPPLFQASSRARAVASSAQPGAAPRAPRARAGLVLRGAPAGGASGSSPASGHVGGCGGRRSGGRGGRRRGTAPRRSAAPRSQWAADSRSSSSSATASHGPAQR